VNLRCDGIGLWLEDRWTRFKDPDVSQQVGQLQQVHQECTAEQRSRACSTICTLNCPLSLQLRRSSIPVLKLAILEALGGSPSDYIKSWPLPPVILGRAVRANPVTRRTLACKPDPYGITKQSFVFSNLQLSPIHRSMSAVAVVVPSESCC
jgi:hypothetical protein